MAIYVYLCIFIIPLFLGIEGMIPGQVGAILSVFGFIMLLVCAGSKPKYKKEELVCSCELLPIVNDIYAIKTDKNKFLCKYVVGEDNNAKTDVINVKTDIVTMAEGEKPTFHLYEKKTKNAWRLSGDYTMYNVVLSIPENSVLE